MCASSALLACPHGIRPCPQRRSRAGGTTPTPPPSCKRRPRRCTARAAPPAAWQTRWGGARACRTPAPASAATERGGRRECLVHAGLPVLGLALSAALFWRHESVEMGRDSQAGRRRSRCFFSRKEDGGGEDQGRRTAKKATSSAHAGVEQQTSIGPATPSLPPGAAAPPPVASLQALQVAPAARSGSPAAASTCGRKARCTCQAPRRLGSITPVNQLRAGGAWWCGGVTGWVHASAAAARAARAGRRQWRRACRQPAGLTHTWAARPGSGHAGPPGRRSAARFPA